MLLKITRTTRNEYYLTDTIKVLNDQGAKVGDGSSGMPEDIKAVNDRVQLAEVNKIMQKESIKGTCIQGYNN